MSWDAKNAFLNGVVPEEHTILVIPPSGYGKGKVLWKLHKALYGLPISSQLWYKEVVKIFEEVNWEKSDYDNCCFYSKNKGAIQAIAVFHADDFLLAGDPKSIELLKVIMFRKFEMKEVTARRYLGITIERNDDGFI